MVIQSAVSPTRVFQANPEAAFYTLNAIIGGVYRFSQPEYRHPVYGRTFVPQTGDTVYCTRSGRYGVVAEKRGTNYRVNDLVQLHTGNWIEVSSRKWFVRSEIVVCR
jgi:hypothetical protein